MLPMGSIMAACMLLAVLFTLDVKCNFLHRLPVWLKRGVAAVILLAGLWNVLWYASRHLFEFWGVAALVSGCLMLMSALYLLQWGKRFATFWRIKPLVVTALFCCCVLYSYTIYHL